MKNIEMNKCIGCRMGVDTWMENNSGKLQHMDLFATYEAGAVYDCNNAENIKPYLKKLKNGLYKVGDENNRIFKQQSYWWEDIVTLIQDIKNKNEHDDDINEIINTNMWRELNDKMLENKLVVLARSYHIDVNPDEYPDLLMWLGYNKTSNYVKIKTN